MKVNNVTEAVAYIITQIVGKKTNLCDIGDTPSRVAKMYKEIFSGYTDKFPAIKLFTLPYANNGNVVVNDIPFFSMCEHHMMPFFGTVQIGYIPHGTIIGLSKIPRTVDFFSRRLQTQERLGMEIAYFLSNGIPQCQGVAVKIKATHLCCNMRGVRSIGANTTTRYNIDDGHVITFD